MTSLGREISKPCCLARDQPAMCKPSTSLFFGVDGKPVDGNPWSPICVPENSCGPNDEDFIAVDVRSDNDDVPKRLICVPGSFLMRMMMHLSQYLLQAKTALLSLCPTAVHNADSVSVKVNY